MPPHDAIGWLVLTGVAGCAVGGIGLLVLALVRTWLAGRHGEEVLQRVAMLTREGNVEEARAAAERLPGSVSSIIAAGLGAPDEATAERVMAQAARDERKRLSAWVRALDLLAGSAILLPLAGIAVRAALLDAPVPLEDWRGALLMLAFGLGTALVATLGRFWVTARVRDLAVEMEKGAAVVYNTAR